MSEQSNPNGAYVRKFSFRPFTGFRRGRIYRIWSISWHWWAHEWSRSRAIKFLIGFQIFTLFLTNLFVLTTKDLVLLANPNLTTEQMLEDTLIPLIRGLVSFQTEIRGGDSNGDNGFGGGSFSIGGTSIFILLLAVLVGSGLIADDISNKTNEIYYSKLEKYEYILGKFGAFFIFGNVMITLPYMIEFGLLFVGLGNIDLISVLPLLVHVIIFTELINLTYAAIILAFSSLTSRRLYAGLTTFMILFLASMIIPAIAFAGRGDVGLQLLGDVLTLLLICSYILAGETKLDFFGGEFTLNLADGIGIESWMVIGSLGAIILLGILIVIFQVYRRHSA
ncbi:MAG: ABC transporter permease [Candidatus Hodarchaeales archaeon]|jgi:ABC-type transport system involved in multi-copper enzyme maturation permease subunit